MIPCGCSLVPVLLFSLHGPPVASPSSGRSRCCSGYRRYREEGRDLLLTRSAPGGSVVSQIPQTQPHQPKTGERPGQTAEEPTRVPTCPILPEAITWGWKAGLVQGQVQDSPHPPSSTDSASQGLLPGRGGMCCHRKMHPVLGNTY